MKYLALSFLLLMSTCRDNDAEEEFKKSCPYEIDYPGHYLKVPVTVTPHKLTYSVGDTIFISTVFPDSIYDLGTQQTFKIEGFPFKPTSLLFRFTDSNTYDSGYSVNEFTIDAEYKPFLFYSTSYTDGYRAYTIYEDGQYKFESRLILKEPGRYVMLFSDIYQDHNASGNPELNEEADAITFEGKCPGLRYYICSMIEGDDHLELFEQELVYLDEEVYKGHLGTIEGSLGPLKSGSIAVEFAGFYGFEVVE